MRLETLYRAGMSTVRTIEVGCVVLAVGAGIVAVSSGDDEVCVAKPVVTLTRQTSPLPATLRGVAYPPGYAAVAVGDEGTILSRGRRAGWVVRDSGVQADLQAVASPASYVVVAVGRTGTIVRSEDAGDSWVPVASPTTADLHALVLEAELPAAIAVGDGVALRSEDEGVTWSLGHVPGDIGALRGVASRRLLEGSFEYVAVGDAGLALRSGDDGRTWEAVESRTQADLRAIGRARRSQGVEGSEFVVAAADGPHRVLQDARRWTRTPADEGLEVFGVSREPGWLVGAAGEVVHAGEMIRGRYVGEDAPAGALLAVDGSELEALAVGEDGAIVRAVAGESSCR